MDAAATYPAIHAFPPFYTRQPHAETWQRQCSLWCDIVVQHCRATHTYVLAMGDAAVSQNGDSARLPATCPPFANHVIGRSLPAEVREAVACALIERGQAAWADDARAALIVFWRPLSELAEAVLAHVRREHFSTTGGAVLTAFELFEDCDDAGPADAVFRGMPSAAALHLVRWMERRGDVAVIGDPAGSFSTLGLKFRL